MTLYESLKWLTIYNTPSAAEPMYNIRMGVEWFMHGVGLYL